LFRVLAKKADDFAIGGSPSSDQAHEQIADSGAIQSLIKQGVFSVKDSLFKILSTRLLSIGPPVPGGNGSAAASGEHVPDGLPQSRGRLRLPFCQLRFHPVMQGFSSAGCCVPDGKGGGPAVIASAPAPVRHGCQMPPSVSSTYRHSSGKFSATSTNWRLPCDIQ
jgi:hypothetical protein